MALLARHQGRQGILTDQEWEAVIRDYLTRMNIIDGDDDQGVTWLAVRHGLSANGNDHVHIMVQLAADDGWINPYHDRINAQKSCRRMEKTRPELVELARSDTGTRVSWQYGQWRQWAEWKARNEYGDDEGWDALDGNERSRLVTAVAASTMPRQHVGRIVEACAKASRSEDEFIRRIRREGFSIDPRLRKGTAKDSFTDPGQVVGYRITWRSTDGWTERFNAFELGDDMRLKRLRDDWADDARSRSLAVQEWRAAMENRPPFLDDGRERHPGNLSTHDMERLVSKRSASPPVSTTRRTATNTGQRCARACTRSTCCANATESRRNTVYGAWSPLTGRTGPAVRTLPEKLRWYGPRRENRANRAKPMLDREFAGSSPGMIGSMDSFAFVSTRSGDRPSASRPSQDSDMPARTFPAIRRAISATLNHRDRDV